jgi:hypothetical protein
MEIPPSLDGSAQFPRLTSILPLWTECGNFGKHSFATTEDGRTNCNGFLMQIFPRCPVRN